MKKLILTLALAFGMTAAAPAAVAAAFEPCLVCTGKTPAKRYAKAHKDKKFKGFKMTKQNRKNAKIAKKWRRQQ